MKNLPAESRFQKLVEDISRLFIDARAAQVKFAWETGRRIVEEEQNGALRAQYGSRLIPELSKILSKKHGPGFSTRTLARMRSFYSDNPILPVATKLAWTDYVELMPVRDKKERRHLEQRVLREGLKSKEIRAEVRKLRKGSPGHTQKAKPVKPLKRPAGLKLNTFSLSPLKVKLRDNQVLVDCGFFVNWPVTKSELKKISVTDKMSYTYSALIERVVDGDTLLVLIDVGFGIIIEERLRLNGINCPELSTPEGQKAKRFVQKLLPAGSTIVLKSQKCRTDIYGRFVADIFFAEGVDSAETIIKHGIYLNQLLLDEGLAQRVEY